MNMTPDQISELRKAGVAQRMALIESLGMFTLKTLLTLNSGATVVLLALLGQVVGGSDTVSVDLAGLRTAMFWFLGGITAVLVVIGVVFFTAQIRLAKSLRNDAKPVGRLTLAAWIYLAAMMLLPLASFACFAAGFYEAAVAFQDRV